MANLFLMRWNPAISSYKLEVYHRNCADYPDGFGIDWSVRSHEEAHDLDPFVMMRVGDHKPGIVFYGIFTSDPYLDTDWAGTDKMKYYVRMNCYGFNEDDEPIITAEELQQTIPGIDWMHGHSGVALPSDISAQVTELLEDHVPDFTYDPDMLYAWNDDDDDDDWDDDDDDWAGDDWDDEEEDDEDDTDETLEDS